MAELYETQLCSSLPDAGSLFFSLTPCFYTVNCLPVIKRTFRRLYKQLQTSPNPLQMSLGFCMPKGKPWLLKIEEAGEMKGKRLVAFTEIWELSDWARLRLCSLAWIHWVQKWALIITICTHQWSTCLWSCRLLVFAQPNHLPLELGSLQAELELNYSGSSSWERIHTMTSDISPR